VKVRNTVILVVIALVLGGYILFVEMKKDTTPETTESVASTRISDIELNDVVEFAVRDEQASIRVRRQDDGIWLIDQAEPVEADPDQIQRAVALVARAEAERTLTGEDAGELADFGLESPSIDVTLKTSDDEEWVLLIGDQNPGKSLYYVMEKSGDAVYMVSSSVVDTVRALISDPPYRPTPTPMASTMPARWSRLLQGNVLMRWPCS
jgi:hypothetical protein